MYVHYKIAIPSKVTTRVNYTHLIHYLCIRKEVVFHIYEICRHIFKHNTLLHTLAVRAG